MKTPPLIEALASKIEADYPTLVVSVDPPVGQVEWFIDIWNMNSLPKTLSVSWMEKSEVVKLFIFSTTGDYTNADKIVKANVEEIYAALKSSLEEIK